MIDYLRAFKVGVRLSPHALWQLLNQETEDAPRFVPAELDGAGKPDEDPRSLQNSGYRALGKGLDPELWVWGKETNGDDPAADDDVEGGPALAPPSIDWTPDASGAQSLRLVKRTPEDPPGKEEEVLHLSMDGLVFSEFEAAGVEVATLKQKIIDALLIEITARPEGGSSVSGYYRSDIPRLADYLQQIGDWVLKQDTEILAEDVPTNPEPASTH